MKPAAFSIAICLVLHAQTADEVLRRGQSRIVEAIDHLPRYTCTQTIDRTYFETRTPNVRRLSCDDVTALRNPAELRVSGSDRLRLDVMVAEEGVEVFSWPGGRSVSLERLEALAGEGPMGTGAFGPFLINIFTTPGVEFTPEGRELLEGRATWRFRYRVPQPVSHYCVIVSGTTRIVGYDGRFWLDEVTFDLLRLTVRSAELSPATGNCEAANSVDFARVKVGTGTYLLPAKNILRIVRRDRSEAENATVYAACHEFHGESTIHFEDDPAPESHDTAKPDREPAYPPGVPIRLDLPAINTATAAAGDLIEARLAHAVPPNRRDNRALPAGSLVRGRITALRRRSGRSDYVALTIQWEALQRGSKWVPFAGSLDEPAQMLEQQRLYRETTATWITRGRRAPASGDTLIFRTSDPKFVVPAGRETRWFSVVPPPER